MENCLFCKIAAHEIPAEIVCENDQTLAFLDIKPVNPGHVLVIPKEHYDDFVSTPLETLNEVMATAHRVIPAVLAATGAPNFNIMAVGEDVRHFHLHVIPRRPSDGLKHWPTQEYASGEITQIAQKIRSGLQV
jgi:histidine triad (HIT) family protein